MDKCQEPLGWMSASRPWERAVKCATHLGFNTQCLRSLSICPCFHSGRPWGERSAWLDPRATARICPQEFQSLWIWRRGALLGKARKHTLAEGSWSKEKPTQQSLSGQHQAQPQVSSRQMTARSFYHDLAEVLGRRQSVRSQQRPNRLPTATNPELATGLCKGALKKRGKKPAEIRIWVKCRCSIDWRVHLH